jgi:hypothetical protein
MKTVKEWFAQLPEPYKTDCLCAAFHYDCIMDVRGSLGDAIAMSIPSWPGLDVEDLIKRANSGEFDAPAIPWPVEASWENAPEGTFARSVDCEYIVWVHIAKKGRKRFFIDSLSCGMIIHLPGIDWKKTFEYNPLLFKK